MSKYLARAILLTLVLVGLTCLVIFAKEFLIAFVIAFAMIVVGAAIVVGLICGLMYLLDQAFSD